MDAIFSLPVLSLFLVPTLSSYSTSLNLIFFYMTWTTLVLSHPPLRVELFATITVRLLFYILPSLAFFLFDILTPSAAVIVKAQGESGLPCGKGRGSKKAKIRWKEIKVALWGLANVVLGIVVQGAIEMGRTKVLGMRSAVKVSVKLPMPWEIVKDLARGLFGREILAYTIHRYILHNQSSSISTVTSYHKTWYHALHTPFPLTAHYDHPLVYLLSNFIPTYGPAMLFRFHMLTYIIYLTLISIEETFAYSGYTFMPTSFFLGGIARRVDMHLLSDAEGNFGPWGVLDWIFGTAVDVDGGEEGEDGDGLGERDDAEREIDEQIRRAIEASRKRVREGRYRGRRKRRTREVVS